MTEEMEEVLREIKKRIKKLRGKKRIALQTYYDILRHNSSYENSATFKRAILLSLKDLDFKITHISSGRFLNAFEKNLKSIDKNLYEEYKSKGYSTEYMLHDMMEKFKVGIEIYEENIWDISDMIREIADDSETPLIEPEKIHIDSLVRIEDLWKSVSEGEFNFMCPLIISQENEKILHNKFEELFKEKFGEDAWKKLDNKEIASLDDEHITFILQYPNFFARIVYEYLNENEIYDERYYRKAFYFASTMGDYTIEESARYVIEFADEGREILEDFILEKGYLHMDITSTYLEDKSNREKYRERICALLNSLDKELFFYGAFLSYHYRDDNKIAEVMDKIAAEIIEGKRKHTREALIEFSYSYLSVHGMVEKL